MNRRLFLSGLPFAARGGTLLAFFRPRPAQAQFWYAAPEEVQDSAYTLGPITGRVARALMPPETPCPLPQSRDFSGLRFTGCSKDYRETVNADTWYPSWAADGTLYLRPVP
jgi:hypothetical protein